MLEWHRFHPGGFDGPGGWHVLGGIVPLLLFLILISVVVWAVVRLSRNNRPWAVATQPPWGRRDQALDELRLKYARGDMSREEFVQRSRDLGSMVPETGEPPPPEAG